MGHFKGYLEGASTFLLHSGQFRGQKSLGSLEISLEMAHYVVCPQKKIMSRIFKISGALIVIFRPLPPIASKGLSKFYATHRRKTADTTPTTLSAIQAARQSSLKSTIILQ